MAKSLKELEEEINNLRIVLLALLSYLKLEYDTEEEEIVVRGTLEQKYWHS